jgi:hypothetical protein
MPRDVSAAKVGYDIESVDPRGHQPAYIRRPFIDQPDPQATAVFYRLQKLLVRA